MNAGAEHLVLKIASAYRPGARHPSIDDVAAVAASATTSASASSPASASVTACASDVACAAAATTGAALAAIWLIPGLRHAAEASMPAHMLVQFPVLLASGWLFCRAATMRWAGLPRFWRGMDQSGLTAIVAVSCVSAFWMVPVALDLALLDARMNLVKYGSWWLGGALLADAWRRLNGGLKLFFLGNIAWMLATAGLIYEEAQVRLCANYLLDEQRWTGWGLVGAACLVGLAAISGWRASCVHIGTGRCNDT
jgi:hypothetical protein